MYKSCSVLTKSGGPGCRTRRAAATRRHVHTVLFLQFKVQVQRNFKRNASGPTCITIKYWLNSTYITHQNTTSAYIWLYFFMIEKNKIKVLSVIYVVCFLTEMNETGGLKIVSEAEVVWIARSHQSGKFHSSFEFFCQVREHTLTTSKVIGGIQKAEFNFTIHT